MRGSDVVRASILAIVGRETFENVRGSLARDLGHPPKTAVHIR